MAVKIERNYLLLVLSVIILLAAVVTASRLGPIPTLKGPEAPKTVPEDSKGPGYVTAMYFTVKTVNLPYTWRELNLYSYLFEENAVVEGVLQVGDEQGPLPNEFGYAEKMINANISTSGANAGYAVQKSYKLTLKKGKWRGQDSFLLKKYINDGLRFRNKLMGDIANEIGGYIVPEMKFVHLYIKDESVSATEFTDYGLYTYVERFSDRFLLSRELDYYGSLYLAEDFNFGLYENALTLETSNSFSKNDFVRVLKTKASEDHSRLLQMLSELNDESVSIETTFEKYFDSDNYFKWLAFQILSGNYKAAASGFGLYVPRGNEKILFVFWDQSKSFSRFEKELIEGVKYELRGDTVLENLGVTPFTSSVLHRRVLSVKKYRELLRSEIEALLSRFEDGSLHYIIESNKAAARYTLTLPDSRYLPLTAETYNMVADHIVSEAREMYDYYLDSLVRPTSFKINPPENGFITWEPSYMLDGGEVAFEIAVSRDYTFKQTVYSEKNALEFQVGTLAPGQYFLKVTAVSPDGLERPANVYYKDIYGRRYAGVLCFYIPENGRLEIPEIYDDLENYEDFENNDDYIK